MQKKQQQTIIGLFTGLVVLYFVFTHEAFLWIAAALGFMALASDYSAGKIVDVWQAVIDAVGFFISRMVLTVIFCIVLVPLAVAYRLFHKDSPLQLRKKVNGTYYTIRHHSFVASDFEKPW